MELGDIWLKIARNQALTPQEEGFLKDSGTNTQQNNSFVNGIQNGNSSINVNNINARTGTFELPPSGISLRLRITSSQTITHDTITTVSFHEKAYDDISMWDSGDPTNINIKVTGKYQISMRVIFASNATGQRAGGLANSGGTFIASNAVAPVNGGSTSVTIVEEINLVSNNQYRARVYQNSGGDLLLSGCTISIRLLRSSDAES